MTSLHRPIYQRRLEVLTHELVGALRPGDKVLDVGCGNGTLGQAVLSHTSCPQGVVVEGLERVKRGGEPIVVHEYDGIRMPMADKTFDVVIIADVLHHEEEPLRLLKECARVSRRLVIIKDHRISGPISRLFVCLMDWAANAPYGVPCLYRYNTLPQWQAFTAQAGLVTRRELRSMSLYPAGWNLIFGRRKQYMAFLAVPGASMEASGA